jgi:SAM-dependent methyltransferase
MSSREGVPAQPRAGLRKLLSPLLARRAAAPSTVDYRTRVDSEKAFFGGDRSAYELPPIFSYWSNKYVRPVLEQFGYSTPDAMYVTELAAAYDASPVELRRFVSLGSGNCASEIAIAGELVARGLRGFTLECVELNADLLAEGKARAAREGLGDVIVAVQGDFNTWRPAGDYDGVLANSSLHHVVNLEGLLDGVRAALRPTATFVTSDMIGRNGHMRWPEALDIVHEYWRELPESYRYNQLLRRQEALYQNWDCSSEGFEGIRAQDILRLLIERFDFDVFVPFANVIDPFIERCFGHNFDPSRDFDVRFVDRVHARDVEEIARGAIKPTHVVAAMCAGRPGRNLWPPGLSPRFCVRDPDRAPVPWRARQSGEPAAPATPSPARDAHAEAAQSPDYSDLWCDPESPGWGLAIHHHRSGLLIANLLLHDGEGRPRWYSIQPGSWHDPRTYVGRVFAVTTPPSEAPLSFEPATLREAGTVRLSFDDASSGSLDYAIDGVSGTRRIRRMQF